ncbi:hypothetical protein ACFSX9_02705 [Flavobacterium ardleyense]|uniref:Lipoprotein n=1 Tax=Flavobacterium ardleyense TaxID=2038737 RepID=A0ABW5Z5N4_9FLAO
MKKFILILTLLFCSCGNRTEVDVHPETMKPNWDGIKTEELKFKIGDAVSIFIAKQYYIGIVMDFDQDENGIWYGICLSDYRWVIPNRKEINELNFLGRQIPNGYNGNYIDCYDLTYLNVDTIAKNITVFDNLKIDIDRISIGEISYAKNLKQLENNYFIGREARKEKITESDKAIVTTEPVSERYFKIRNILIN